MSAGQSWGADTVALGRKAGSEESPPEPRRGRVSRPKLPRPRPRALALGSLALAVVVALIATLGGGTKSRPALIRKVADPAPTVVVKPPMRMRRRKPRPASKPHIYRKRAGRLEDEREPKASATSQEPDAPEVVPEAVAVPSPSPTLAPTPPSVEFGM
jgi:hypothetical protein